MLRRNTRVLWLLNHKTLMPYEVPLLRRLGYEVFVPKIIPAKNFRSAAVDFSHDASLTIPSKALEALNAFNLYEDAWTPEITRIVNRYFGAAFVMLHRDLLAETTDKFEGQIVLRAFGLPNETSYTELIRDLNGPVLLRKLENLGDRFWFGEGYDNLHEVEAPLLQHRALHLPIGIPDSFFANAGRWVGSDPRILFVCPDIRTDDYHAKIYREFKQNFGHLPHVIAGIQREPVDDPHVVGFVTDEELTRLYLECAVLYYHSREVRHVHYPPIEAAINGMPVVFYEGSLLDRMGSSTTLGRVPDVAAARRMIEQILDGDRALVDELTTAQRSLPDRFTEPYCTQTWASNMDQQGFNAALRRQSSGTLMNEARRAVLAPWAKGKTAINPHRAALRTPGATHTLASATTELGGSLLDGIHFADRGFPGFVHYIDGIGAPESWGRWSSSDAITVVLKHPLEGDFRLFLRGAAHGANIDVPVPVTIGTATEYARFGEDTQNGVWLHFDLDAPSNTIEIRVPSPTQASSDPRVIGVGLSELRMAAPVTLTMDEAESALGTSLARGIDFSDPDLCPLVAGSEGLGEAEEWGRWSVRDSVRLELAHTLEGDIALLLRAVGNRANVGVPVPVTIGDQTRHVTLPGSLAPEQELTVWFDALAPSNVVSVDVPHPERPPGETRTVGIGFYGLRARAVPDDERRPSLDDGIDFTAAAFPSFVHGVEGLAAAESWGRWSVGTTVRIRLDHPLQGRVTLFVRAGAYGPNAGVPIPVRIGGQTRHVMLSSQLDNPSEIPVEFDLRAPSDVIEIIVPTPTTPPTDSRAVGIGLVSLRTTRP